MGWIPTGGGASPLTTKGDLYTYDTADARLPVGSDGQVLEADSAQTTGLKWATPTDTIAESAKASRKSTNQSISNNTLTAIQFDTEEWDDNNLIDLGTNNTRITIQTAGKYQITASVRFVTSSNGDRAVQVRKNGTTNLVSQANPAGTGALGSGHNSVSVVDDAAANDYYEAMVFQDSGSSLNLDTDIRNQMSVARVA